MSKNIIELKEHLIHKYNLDEKYLNKLSEQELNELYEQKEKESLIIAKNPNKFFYIKSLPVPKEVETKTSSIGGKIVFFAFIIMLLLFFVLFFVLAFIKHFN
ncbi:hypothetical protein [Mycoplasmopsis cynos]|uniref:Uncharacterized protein n=1 Tax=Mycoplasmopsis cynos TaxID=171284 RepID=A0A449AI02_9BACT|nr:hypothetical protein [Mycoplasmopsis cynos]TQC54712.1 hypothetical protein E1I74_01830 [Mycoplasmopsis cynos]VEU64599.1 Uncharacterised protein [Mycoplasmopsis cynos]